MMTSPLHAQTAGVGFVHDENFRLTRVTDAAGNSAIYSYDSLGNLLSISHANVPANALAIFAFSPQQGPVGTIVTIQGQNFNPVAGSNSVQFNGMSTTVLSATATALTAAVPASATSGPLSVTVNGVTAPSSDPFTVLAIGSVFSVSPKYIVSSATGTQPNLQITGVNLAGASFAFLPAYQPVPVAISAAAIDPSGTSATLTPTVTPAASGTFTLVSTNAAGSSSSVPVSGNTLQVLAPDGDADSDGVTNAVEIALGSDPLNPKTSNAGIVDGWQVFYGLNPVAASSAGPDPGKSGSTALQDFQQNLSPVNPNRVPPGVVEVYPANSATDVSINSSITFRFGEPLRIGVQLSDALTAINKAVGAGSSISATSLTAAATTLQGYLNRGCCGNSVIQGVVTMTGPFGNVAGSIAPSSDGLSVTFIPFVPLAAYTNYTVQVNGVRDSAGNLMTVPFSSSFLTSAAVDSTPSTIKLVDPEANSIGVPTNAHWTVQFNQVMDPSSITLANFSIVDQTTNLPIAGLIQVDPSGTTASFVPSSPLPIQRAFTVTLGPTIKDASENFLGTISTYAFTTGYTPETAAPHLIATSPVNGATNIAVNSVIDLQFSQPIDIATIVPNIQVSVNNLPVPVQMAASVGDQHVTLTPVGGLSANAVYTVTIGPNVSNIAGALLDNPSTFTFTTGAAADTSTLTLTSAFPAAYTNSVPLNVHLGFQFSKPVDVVSVSNVTFNACYTYGSLPFTITAGANQTSVTLVPAAPLVNGTAYCVNVSGITDLEGNAISSSGTTVSYQFTTGTTTQSTGPTVIAVSPVSGSGAVPLNAKIEVGFSEAISAVNLGGTITVTAGGQTVAGTVTSPNATSLLFTPTSPLAANTAYTVTASGINDLAGNPLTSPFTSSFTTSASASTTILTLVSTSPADGATGVPVTTPIVLTFNEPINPVSVISSGMLIKANGSAFAGSYSVSGATITFTPLTPLPGNAKITIAPAPAGYQYYLTNYIQDLTGNNYYNATVTTFTTAATPDTTAPTVVSVTPTNGQTGVGLSAPVAITFSKSMNPSTLTSANISLLAGDTVIYAGSYNISADNRSLVITPSNLLPSATITLSISSAVTDLSGNSVGNYISHFTTMAAADTSNASIISQRPAMGATGVAIGASPIVLFASKPLNPATVSNNTIQVSQNGQPVSGTLAVVGDGRTVEFTPASNFNYGAQVQLFVDPAVLDISGNPISAYKGSFTVAGNPATTAPLLLATTVSNTQTGIPLNAVINLVYSAALDPITVIAANIRFGGPSGFLTPTLTLDPTGTIIQIVQGAPLSPNTQYQVQILSLEGANGIQVAQQDFAFTTGATTQTTAPSITAVVPSNNLNNVPINANIQMLFSGPIDPTSVSGTTITVSGGGVTAIPSSISFSNNNQQVLITPQSPLPLSTAMTLTVSGVTDIAGNPVAPQTTHFNTGANASTAGVGVIASNPAQNIYNNVPLNTVISLQMNAEIDPTTVSSATFQVVDQTTASGVPGTYSLSPDDTTLYFAPTAPLPAGRLIVVSFDNTGLKDLAGNVVTGCSGCTSYLQFTTAFSAVAVPLTVRSLIPSTGMANVPLNAKIMALLSAPVNPEFTSAITLMANGASIPVTVTFGSGNQLLTIAPAAGLAPNTAYTLSIGGLNDISGNTMSAPVTTSFMTSASADLTPLVATASDPTRAATGVPLNAKMQVRFNKPVNLLQLAGAPIITVTPANASNFSIPGNVVISADGMTAAFTPASNFLPESSYVFYVNGSVQDLAGNQLATIINVTFTTSLTPQTTGPTVTGISPANGSQNVPVNAVVEVALNESASSVSVGTSAITMTSGGQTVAGTITLPTPASILFTPASPMATGTAYTVNVTGFTDLAGNAATSFSSNFTTSTSTTTLTAAPTVLSVSPANGATAVSVTAPIVITFSAPMNALTLSSSSIFIQDASYQAVAATYALNGAVLTITPISPLPPSQAIRVYLPAYTPIQDIAGNTLLTGPNDTFTTAATRDTTAPSVVMVTPSNGQTGVGLSGQIVVVFSKSMNPSTLLTTNIALLAGDTKQTFNISTSYDNRSLILSNLNLAASSNITLSITGATDLIGNALPSFLSTFTTTSAIDLSSASVVTQRPGNGATGVSLAASPVVLFMSKPINASTVTSSSVQVTQNGQVVNGTLAVAGNGEAIVFTPSSAWTYGALIQVFVQTSVIDTVGNPVYPYTGTFNIVGDPAVTAPSVINLSPINQSSGIPTNYIGSFQYSGPIDPSTVTPANVYLSLAGTDGTVPSTATLDSTGTILHLTPSSPATPNTYYEYNAQNLKGTNGTSAQGTGTSYLVGAGPQTSAPPVLAVSPQDKSANVPVNAMVGILFAGPLDPTSVNVTTILLTANGQTVPSTISLSDGTQRVQLTPQAPLAPSTLFTVTISGLTDIAGNLIATQTTHFTTGTGAVTVQPAITLTNPYDTATAVPINSIISLQSNTPIDGTSVTSGSFQVLNQTTNQGVAGTYSLSTDGMTVFFVPSAPLPSAQQFLVSFTNHGITDLAGNALQSYYYSGSSYVGNFSFTTGTAASTTPPQVVGLSPSTGMTSVPVNTQVSVAFSEPVDAESLAGVTLSSNGNTVSAAETLNSGNQLLTLTPAATLAPGTPYSLTIAGVTDLSGNVQSAPVTGTFTTGGSADVTTPTVVSATPATNATGVLTTAPLQVQFSKQMNGLTFNNQSVLFTSGDGTSIAATYTLSQNGTSLTITPASRPQHFNQLHIAVELSSAGS